MSSILVKIASVLDMFDPSMFIGYKKNTVAEYERGTSNNHRYMDGWDTEVVIRQWSIEAKGFSEYYED